MLIQHVGFCLISLGFSHTWLRCIFRILKSVNLSYKATASSKLKDGQWWQIISIFSLSFGSNISSWILDCPCSCLLPIHLSFPTPCSLQVQHQMQKQQPYINCLTTSHTGTMSSTPNKSLIPSHFWWFCCSDKILNDREGTPGPLIDALLYIVQLKPHKTC